jgi:hypothetical protein
MCTMQTHLAPVGGTVLDNTLLWLSDTIIGIQYNILCNNSAFVQ